LIVLTITRCRSATPHNIAAAPINVVLFAEMKFALISMNFPFYCGIFGNNGHKSRQIVVELWSKHGHFWALRNPMSAPCHEPATKLRCAHCIARLPVAQFAGFRHFKNLPL